MESDVTGLLERALEKVEAGWGKGKTFHVVDGVTHYCLAGAVLYSRLEKQPTEDVYSAAGILKVLLEEKGVVSDFPGSILIYWNDRPERKKDDVLELLRKAIEISKEGK